MITQIITEVSLITHINGVAKIRLPDGALKELKAGDTLQPGAVVILDEGVQLTLKHEDTKAEHQDLPQTAATDVVTVNNSTSNDIAQLQQNILDGVDPTKAFEAAAAGATADAGTGAGSGNSGFVSIDRSGDATIAEAGYDTTTVVSSTSVDLSAVEPVTASTSAVDSTPPSITVDVPALTNDSTPTITGTTDLNAGSTVTLLVTDSTGAQQIIIATVQSDGTYNVDVPSELAEGNYSVTATATDTAGNGSSASDTGSLDVTAPTITVDAPALTNDSTPTITGTTNLPANSIVTLLVTDSAGNQQTFTATVQANGSYSVDVPTALAEGDYDVTAKVTDIVGNIGTANDSGSLDVLNPTILSVSVSNTDAKADEGSALNFKVDLSAASEQATSHSFSLAGVTAAEGDFDRSKVSFSNGVSLSADGKSVIVPAGVSSFTVSVPTINDTVDEADETLKLAVGGKDATGTIVDNDAAPIFQDITNGAYKADYFENSKATDILKTVSALDADGGAVIYRITEGNADGWYSIDSNGNIRLTDKGVSEAANDFERGSSNHLLTVVASDGTNSTDVKVTLTEKNVNEAPIITSNAATISLSEESLSGGIIDRVGHPYDSTDATEAGGKIMFSDVDSSNLTVSLVAPDSNTTLTSGGQAISWTLSSDGHTLTGATANGSPVITATIDNSGNYNVTLLKAIDHAETTTGVEDIKSLGIGVIVSDGHLSATSTITVNIEDDMPISSANVQQVNVGSNTNITLILDVSGSMAGDKLTALKNAALSLLNTYDALGNIKVQLVTFSTHASSTVWLTKSEAITQINNLTADGGTNYDEALADAIAGYTQSGKIVNANNVSYFISDGVPTYGSGTTTALVKDSSANPETNGDGSSSTSNSDVGIQADEQSIWENFLNSNKITSYAVAIGSDAATVKSYLDPIAYNGASSKEVNVLSVSQVSDLSTYLQGTVIKAVTGSLVTGAASSVLGADGGAISSITVSGEQFNASGLVTGSATGVSGSWSAATDTWTITTATGAIFTINMVTGAYSYQALPTSSHVQSGYQETIQYTLIDNDKDTFGSSLTFKVPPVADSPTLTISNHNVLIAADFDNVSLGNKNNNSINVANIETSTSTQGWFTHNTDSTVEIGKENTYLRDNVTSNNVIELEKDRGDVSDLYTSIDTKAGETYTVTFDYSARSEYTGTDSEIDVYWEGFKVASITSTTVGWKSYTYTFVATTDGTSVVKFVSQNTDSLGGVLDNISVSHSESSTTRTYAGYAGYIVSLPSLSASITDASEALSLSVSGLKVGDSITDGTHVFTAYDSAHTAVDITGWTLSSLGYISETAGTNSLVVTATSTASSAHGSSSASTSETLTVTVDAESSVISNSTSDIGTSSDDLSLSATSTAGEYIWGRAGADTITGNSGADHLFGGSGDDKITGGAGDDVVFGGSGKDALIGGLGEDILTGGTGADIFIWAVDDKGETNSPVTDTITDFDKSSDFIDISDLLDHSSTGLEADLKNYLSIGSDSNSNLTIQIHASANGKNDVTNTIVLQGVHSSDFGAGATSTAILNTLIDSQHLLIDKH